MKLRNVLLWIIALTAIDLIIKAVINTYYLDVNFEIIPGLFEFKPVFNLQYFYVNQLLNLNLGFLFYLVFWTILFIILVILYDYTKRSFPASKLLDSAFIFGFAGYVCALLSNLLWEGCLDYIYLKPLFVFDLKDLYLNCFTILFLIFVLKNVKQLNGLYKMKHVLNHIKGRFNRKNEVG